MTHWRSDAICACRLLWQDRRVGLFRLRKSFMLTKTFLKGDALGDERRPNRYRRSINRCFRRCGVARSPDCRNHAFAHDVPSFWSSNRSRLSGAILAREYSNSYRKSH